MALILWKTQKQPLLPEDVDGNFEYLDQRLQKLEAQEVKPVGIAQITLKNNALLFEGTDGAVYPLVQLPYISWKRRGLWAKDTEYTVYDVVQHESCLYLCKQFHVSAVQWSADYWDLLFRLPIPSLKEVHGNPVEGDLAIMTKQGKKQLVCFLNGKWEDL